MNKTAQPGAGKPVDSAQQPQPQPAESALSAAPRPASATGPRSITAPRYPAAVPPQPAPAPAPAPKPEAAAPPLPRSEEVLVRPPVGPARARGRHVLVFLSFLICVVAPGIGTGVYLWNVAADQYVSKVGFSVRSEESSSALDLLGGIASLSGSSSSDVDILFEFIKSQKLVSDMNAELDLRNIWTKPKDDVVFALTPDSSIEELVDYWNKMVRLSFGATGLLEVEVRAFEAEDATRIAEMLFVKSSEMINELSAIAREDAIRYSREDLDEAVERLKTAREVLTRFRNENQLVNPELDLQSQAGLLANLQAQQAEAIIDIELLRKTVRDGDPRLDQAERRLAVIESVISSERQKLGFGIEGSTGGRAFADVIGEYERLVVEREFTEQAYVAALASYDGALADSRRQSRYLAAYMQPTRAETAVYPERPTLLLLVSLFLFLIWSMAVLIGYSIKDRR